MSGYEHASEFYLALGLTAASGVGAIALKEKLDDIAAEFSELGEEIGETFAVFDWIGGLPAVDELELFQDKLLEFYDLGYSTDEAIVRVYDRFDELIENHDNFTYEAFLKEANIAQQDLQRGLLTDKANKEANYGLGFGALLCIAFASGVVTAGIGTDWAKHIAEGK